jgi:endonuclease/exonuclease/phosphatase family metal-dependent hydrolase
MGMAQRIRAMTWNIWGRNWNWYERYPIIVSIIREIQPDIIALQEVWAESMESTAGSAHAIAEELGYHCYSIMAAPLDDFYIGNAVLSRWPIVHSGYELLPTDAEGSERRVAAYSLVSCQCGTIPVVTAHLSWERHLSQVRQLQTESLARLATRLADSEWPPILMGDFNCDPDSDEIRMLTGRRSRPPGLVVFQDAWEQAGNGSDGFTWAPRNSYFTATRHLNLTAMPWLRRRLDYIFIGLPDGRDDKILPIQVEAARLVGEGDAQRLEGSDHYGVVADLVPHRLDLKR